MTFNFGEYKDWSTHGTWYSPADCLFPKNVDYFNSKHRFIKTYVYSIN
jgi:hypothetical protein